MEAKLKFVVERFIAGTLILGFSLLAACSDDNEKRAQVLSPPADSVTKQVQKPKLQKEKNKNEVGKLFSKESSESLLVEETIASYR